MTWGHRRFRHAGLPLDRPPGPDCGDDAEANARGEAECRKYDRYMEKRRRMEALERRAIEEFVRRLERE